MLNPKAKVGSEQQPRQRLLCLQQPGGRATCGLERAHERHDVLLLLAAELQAQHDVEELGGVFQR